jgi:NADPH:quinone reductase-like Zn-dependent oxidoreductase
MKAIFLEKKSGTEALVAGEMPRPNPREGEVLVQVHATAVMPSELGWFPTFNQSSGQPRKFPIILSHEFSGAVESVEGHNGDFSVGEEVYGINDWFANGAQAEYCVVAETALAHKPKSLRHTEAAVVPISALTAWQGLFEKTKLERHHRVLIHGASGAVGTFAVQLARWRGAHVTATASADNIDFVRALGADTVVDYHATRFEDVICDVDIVFDAVGGETLERSWKVLKPTGQIVTIVGSAKDSPDIRVRDAFMLVRADGEQLAEIGKMIDAGELRVFMEATYPLAEARDAYARAGRGKLRGKIALNILEDSVVSENPKNP